MKAPRQPCNESARQRALEGAGLLQSPADSRLDRLTEVARFSLSVPIALVTLVDNERQWFKSRQGLNVPETSREISFCGHVIYWDTPMLIPDATEDERFADNPLVTGSPGIRFYAGVPIHDESGYPLGTLCVIDTQPRTFDESQMECLQRLADLAEESIRQDQRQARSLDQAQRQRELELARTNRALALLNDIAFELQGSLDEQIQQALALGRQFLGLDIGIVSDITGGWYTVRWCDATDGVPLEPGQQFPLGDTYCDMALSQKRELAISSMKDSDASAHPCYEAFQLEAYIGTRLEGETQDDVFGTVNFSSPQPREPFNDSERLFIRLLGQWVSHQLIHHNRQHELEKLLQQIPGAIYQFRLWPDGTMAFPFMSSGVEALYGVTPDEAMRDAQSLFSQTHPEDLPTINASIQRSFETLEPWNIEFRTQRDDDLPRWMKGSSVPEKLPDGSVLWHGFLGDIHQRKQAELALESSEARLRGLFEFSPIGIALNDLETGRFLELNDALLAPTGYTREEFPQLTHWELTPIEYEPRERKALETLRTTGRYGPYEKEFIRKDGSRYPVRLQGMQIRDANGKPLIWSLIEDITESKQIENMKNQFIATVSHELRTPLTAIMGSLKLVNSGTAGQLPEKAGNLLTIAQRNSERLAQLINDLLDMEKLVSGKLRISTRIERLNPIIDEALEANRELGTERGITLAYQACTANFAVDVDRDRLIQALSNLLSNAIKFSPDHSSVEIRCSCDDQLIAIHVQDRGPGVPQEFEYNLFDRFAQAEASNRKKPGTGLGLAITRELVEQMGGSIHYQAREGGGATFTIVLPIAEPTF
ncbi:GAF domain-containing protein [Halovibrio salipaludis]|uniref:GAF domain-containing protein n=1 Tax=Halovibrio salipaludis TaxID=2032626 RepID=UPI0018E97C13|nr:GAF domain-containing protein [Halovibrio salipaludis]